MRRFGGGQRIKRGGKHFDAGGGGSAGGAERGRLDHGPRRERLKSSYAALIQAEEREERARRVQAIAQFEQFLVRYPSHVRYTPDALFRLAELYFERSSEEFIAAVKQRSGTEAGAEGAGLPDFGASIELYKRLLRSYPDYRNSDGAHYLLGYCLGEMGNDREARMEDGDQSSQVHGRRWFMPGIVPDGCAARHHALYTRRPARAHRPSP